MFYIVSVVNYILGDTLEECQLQAADMNGDSEINVLDIVSIVNVILGGRTSDATSATMDISNDTVSIWWRIYWCDSNDIISWRWIQH